MSNSLAKLVFVVTAAFFALMLGVGVPVWTALDRALLSRWLLAPDEAIALAALAVAATVRTNIVVGVDPEFDVGSYCLTLTVASGSAASGNSKRVSAPIARSR